MTAIPSPAARSGRMSRTLRNPATINLIGSTLLKLFGFVYSLSVVGVAARQLPFADTARVLMAFNFLAPLGLVQAGLGALALRAIIHTHARGGDLAEVSELPLALRFTALVAGTAMVACVLGLPRLDLGFLIPTAMLMLTGFVAGVAEQVWIGTERGWVTNINLTVSYLALGSLFVVLHLHGTMPLWLIALVTYGAPGVSSIIACVLLVVTNPGFRQAALHGRLGHWRENLAKVVPMFLASLSVAALIALPTLGLAWHGLPQPSPQETPLLRLATILGNAVVAVFTPLLPTLVRAIHQEARHGSFRIAKLWMPTVWGIIAVMAGVLYLVLPTFLHIWIALRLTDHAILLPWACVLALWAGTGIAGQFSVMTSSPLKQAMVVACCDMVILALMIGARFGLPIGLAPILIIGLCVHVGGSLWLSMHTMLRARGQFGA
jgi:hypothetical protein